jgi:hypothetical protein
MMRETQWRRLGGVAGLLFVVLTLITVFIPFTTPAADVPTSEIVTVIVDDRTNLLTFGYLLGLGAAVFMVFTAALYSLLRRGEGRTGGPSVIVLAGGIGTSLILVVSQAVLAATIYAADRDAEPEAIRALFELSTPLYTSSALMLTLFLAGTAFSLIPSRVLPRWLGWTAAALAIAFFVSLLSIFSSAEGGGFLGVFFFLGELGLLVWILMVSIIMLRARDIPPSQETPEATAG